MESYSDNDNFALLIKLTQGSDTVLEDILELLYTNACQSGNGPAEEKLYTNYVQNLDRVGCRKKKEGMKS